ncbi:MAG: DUF2141 domain-containing protein [Bacteroides sp.]|nr:DUF2141 domain-containing protein [Bacteroides sp.]
MRKQFIFTALAIALGMNAEVQSTGYSFYFNNLPYAEGTLFVSAAYGDNEIFRKAIEIDSEAVVISVDLSGYVDKDISINAFQDLNENRALDFDSYGRPVEPCLRTKITPKEDKGVYEFRMIQY